MALIKCEECGKEFSENAESCPKCGNPNKKYKEVIVKNEVKVDVKEKSKGKWSTAKLIIGIISMVLFLLISLQSCAAGLSNALSDNGSTSGSAGIGCAFFTLIGGIISVATRNSKGKGGSIAAIILYWLAALLTIGTGDTYGDLPIWGSVAFCFGLINLGSILATKEYFKEPKKSKILVGIVIAISIVAFVIGLSSGSSSTENNNSNSNTNSNTSQTNNENNNSSNSNSNSNTNSNSQKKSYGLGETFNFDDLEITIGDSVSFTTVKNKYSDYNGKDIIKLPITVKNLKDETHGLNMFYYKVYGSQGTEVDTVSSYFDDAIDYAGDLRSGASYTKNMYIVYDGNGQYAIEFDDWAKKITVEFDISK